MADDSRRRISGARASPWVPESSSRHDSTSEQCFANRVPRRAGGFRRRRCFTTGARGASRTILKVLQLPRIRRKNMPVSLTAALQFLPTRFGRRFLFPAPDSALERRSNGLSVGPPLRWHTGCRMLGSLDFRNPHAPSDAQAETARRGADARARRARAGGRARSPRSQIASGAAETITLHWYAPCSFNEAPPAGGASKCREES